MPSFAPDESTRRLVLTDAGRLRYEAVSFFLVMLLLSALAVRLLWNYLARDFPALPRLSFAKSLGVVARWGLLVLVVLTMIAAAREMMTPGSWKKQGLLYTLDDSNIAKPVALEPVKEIGPELGEVRRKGLEDLKAALWNYAAQHKVNCLRPLILRSPISYGKWAVSSGLGIATLPACHCPRIRGSSCLSRPSMVTNASFSVSTAESNGYLPMRSARNFSR